MPSRLRRDEAGFSLPEILTIVAIIGVLFGITIIAFQAAAVTIQGDSNLRIIEGQLKFARDTAIQQRRSVRVQLVAPNVIRVIRLNADNSTTLISSATMENNTTYVDFVGVPDSPDSFGGISVFDPSDAAGFLFTADGMFTTDAGNPVNATIFIGQTGKLVTARCVTVFGTTARIRAYRWNGSQWQN